MSLLLNDSQMKVATSIEREGLREGRLEDDVDQKLKLRAGYLFTLVYILVCLFSVVLATNNQSFLIFKLNIVL